MADNNKLELVVEVDVQLMANEKISRYSKRPKYRAVWIAALFGALPASDRWATLWPWRFGLVIGPRAIAVSCDLFKPRLE
jgi:hypothetical protein